MDTIRFFISRRLGALTAVVVFMLGLTIFLNSQHRVSGTTSAAVMPETRADSVVQVDSAQAISAETVALDPKPVETLEHYATGSASYYGPGFAGRPTANGERFNPAEMTAAHKTLPFGTRLRVTNLANGKTVVVRVNDRGPYAKGRILDLSKGAAQRIGMISSGHAQVKLEIMS